MEFEESDMKSMDVLLRENEDITSTTSFVFVVLNFALVATENTCVALWNIFTERFVNHFKLDKIHGIWLMQGHRIYKVLIVYKVTETGDEDEMDIIRKAIKSHVDREITTRPFGNDSVKKSTGLGLDFTGVSFNVFAGIKGVCDRIIQHRKNCTISEKLITSAQFRKGGSEWVKDGAERLNYVKCPKTKDFIKNNQLYYDALITNTILSFEEMAYFYSETMSNAPAIT